MKDKIRNLEVLEKPEEIVRQNLISSMVDTLGYPKAYLAVEKDLKSLPHLKDIENLPQRRIDIICFSKEEENFSPVLLVECKAKKITKEAEEQVIGYNHFVQSYFISIATEKSIKTLWYDDVKKEYLSINFLPSYKQLIYAIKNR